MTKKWLLTVLYSIYPIYTMLWLLLPTFAHAQQLYKVEVVVFKHITEPNLIPDSWSSKKQQALLQNSQNLTPSKPGEVTEAYQVLPKESLTLMSEQRALARKKNYQILLHIAWLQPITERKFALPIHLYGGKTYNHEGQTTGEATSIYDPEETAYYNEGQWELNGTLQISRSRFFKLNADLLLTQPNPHNQNNELLAHYLLKQNQNMRTDELHYFDHPQFGMLAKITMVASTEEDELPE